MNINKLIKKIKNEIGMTKHLSTSYSDKDIYDIIVEHALKDWSYYFKYEFEPETVHFDDSNVMGPDILGLPEDVINTVRRSGLVIEDIKKVRFLNSQFGDIRGVSRYLVNSGNNIDMATLYAGHVRAQMQGDTDVFNMYRYSCWFEKPNQLRFNYNINDTSSMNVLKTATMSVYTTLSPNLVGISPTREPYFSRLAKLYVMKIIYDNEAKYMESISSGAGQITLKIEEWANAGEQIKDLLKELESFSVLHQSVNMMI